ncbi:MAG: hypothetical protein A2041_13250 [Bacteroidetes bacterium GWA2_31_9b]|nr:MAG: hypothetical protein A2041_13250 [Bacteroidetes bacterium GWA2_31_9b]
MKQCRTAIALLLIFFAFACNNNQNKENAMNPSDVKKTTTDDSNVENKDQTIKKGSLQPESIVKEILTTSPRYTELTNGLNERIINNGGLSFEILMEKSPDQSQINEYSYSETYDFTLYEMYPDRRLSIARFSFNPNNKKLYEFDAANDQLKPIEFDKNLLLKYEALIK